MAVLGPQAARPQTSPGGAKPSDVFVSKKVLRHVHMGTRKDTSAKSCATIRSLHERATCTSSRSDQMTLRVRIQ